MVLSTSYDLGLVSTAVNVTTHPRRLPVTCVHEASQPSLLPPNFVYFICAALIIVLENQLREDASTVTFSTMTVGQWWRVKTPCNLLQTATMARKRKCRLAAIRGYADAILAGTSTSHISRCCAGTVGRGIGAALILFTGN